MINNLICNLQHSRQHQLKLLSSKTTQNKNKQWLCPCACVPQRAKGSPSVRWPDSLWPWWCLGSSRWWSNGGPTPASSQPWWRSACPPVPPPGMLQLISALLIKNTSSMWSRRAAWSAQHTDTSVQPHPSRETAALAKSRWRGSPAKVNHAEATRQKQELKQQDRRTLPQRLKDGC